MVQPVRAALWGDAGACAGGPRPPAPHGDPASEEPTASGAAAAGLLRVHLAAAGALAAHAAAHAPAATQRTLLRQALEPGARGGAHAQAGASGGGAASGSEDAAAAAAAAAVLDLAERLAGGNGGGGGGAQRPLFTADMASGLAAAVVAEAAAGGRNAGAAATAEAGPGGVGGHGGGCRAGLLTRVAAKGAPQLCATVDALAAAAGLCEGGAGVGAGPEPAPWQAPDADAGARRAGGKLLVRLYLAAPDGVLAALPPGPSLRDAASEDEAPPSHGASGGGGWARDGCGGAPHERAEAAA